MADDNRAAVNRGLMDQATIKQLSSTGDEAKRRREELKAAREQQAKEEQERTEAAKGEGGEGGEGEEGEQGRE
jgi:hypothetical protein